MKQDSPLLLYCWELGDGYGHIGAFSGMARLLSQRSVRLSAVVKRRQPALELIEPYCEHIIDAPKNIQKPGEKGMALTFAELIWRCDFYDQSRLLKRVTEWVNIFNELRPQLLILDHSPTALLAAAVVGTPCILYGTGFHVPLNEYPCNGFFKSSALDIDTLKRGEAILVENINAVLAAFEKPAISALFSLYQPCPKLFHTFRELDHFQGRTDADYFGPLQDVGVGLEPEWPEVPGPRVFVYLSADVLPALGALLQALESMQVSCLVYCSGLSGEAVNRFQRPNIRFAPGLLNMRATLRNCRLGICHGGMGTTSYMLLNKIPILALPRHLEQRITAQTIHKQGWGLAVEYRSPAIPYARLLTDLLSNPKYRTSLNRFAKKYKNYNHGQSLQRATNAVLEHLASVSSL